MPLKVIGVGFGRTGTESLYAALNQLGLPCYHMSEVMKNKRNTSHLDFWLQAARSAPGTQHDWESAVFSRYAAAVDNPACVVWRELMAAYPDAKLILTLHPQGPEAWWESTMQTIYFTENMWQFKVLYALTPFGRKFGEMVRKLVWQRGHQNTMGDRDRAVAYYQLHIDTIRKEVPPEKLLVFKATDGWQPLCDFLGIAVPATPFPNVNSREQFQATKRTMVRGAYLILALATTLLAGVAYWVAA